MTTAQNLAFLGAGNMARALLRGCLKRAGLSPEQLGATDASAQALAQAASDFGVQTFASNAEATEWASLIVLAVKPQVVPAVLFEIAPYITPDKLVISIAAGIPTTRISESLGGHPRVVRAMPNTPAIVGEGATAIAGGRDASSADVAVAETLFRSVGIVVHVAEGMLDAVTGLSGSGPAYAFIAIEALSDAGVRAGLPRDVATKLAAQTLLGAGKLTIETGEHPARLKDMVTSPAGTTIAGVAALEREGFRHALHAAVEAATSRSRELGK
ncbi:MAG: pyrroline-5-carboxylate reductase [Myxococcaceae bacterium]|nr:pyrroline-5-carboxylate reductase [Myxococcaceae bacterium]